MKKTPELFMDTFEILFDKFLASYGFSKTISRSNGIGFNLIYRDGERYIHFGGTLDLRDHPFYYHLSLGEGSDTFPEADWNAVALWRIIRNVSPWEYEKYRDLYDIPDDITPEKIDEKIHTNLELFKIYATGFLNNDLTIFKQVRALQNKDREPYRISRPDGKGGRSISYDERSKALKEKYSR